MKYNNKITQEEKEKELKLKFINYIKSRPDSYKIMTNNIDFNFGPRLVQNWHELHQQQLEVFHNQHQKYEKSLKRKIHTKILEIFFGQKKALKLMEKHYQELQLFKSLNYYIQTDIQTTLPLTDLQQYIIIPWAQDVEPTKLDIKEYYAKKRRKKNNDEVKEEKSEPFFSRAALETEEEFHSTYLKDTTNPYLNDHQMAQAKLSYMEKNNIFSINDDKTENIQSIEVIDGVRDYYGEKHNALYPQWKYDHMSNLILSRSDEPIDPLNLNLEVAQDIKDYLKPKSTERAKKRMMYFNHQLWKEHKQKNHFQKKLQLLKDKNLIYLKLYDYIGYIIIMYLGVYCLNKKNIYISDIILEEINRLIESVKQASALFIMQIKENIKTDYVKSYDALIKTKIQNQQDTPNMFQIEKCIEKINKEFGWFDLGKEVILYSLREVSHFYINIMSDLFMSFQWIYTEEKMMELVKFLFEIY